MYDDEDVNNNRVEFSYYSNNDGVMRRSSISVQDQETYREVAQQFVYFLQSIGYSYIYGMTLHGERGKDLHTTEF